MVSIAVARIYQFLASKQLALWLFLFLCLSLIPGTLEDTARYQLGGMARILIGGMGLNLILCTIQRFNTLQKPVLIMHTGVILTMAGAVIGSFGYVATVNIYEGASADRVYRWDLNEDVPLGAALTVKKMDFEYYPVPVRVGVLKGEERIGLFELKTGASFDLAPYTIKAEFLQLPEENLLLHVFLKDRYLGTADTSDTKDPNLPADFPYRFRLVQFQERILKRTKIDLVLTKDSEVLAEGISEVNSPFQWNGLNFYYTNFDKDEFGDAYAGIQIVKDPGRPVVFTGFGVIMAGSLLWAFRKLRRVRKGLC